MQLELIPGVQLSYETADQERAPHFKEVFLATWQSLPNGILRVLRAHWLKRQSGPLVEFIRFPWNPMGNIGGSVEERGHHLKFNALVFILAQPDLFRAAIAHELSHVLFHALDQPQHVWLSSHEDKIGTEILAMELTRRMGFPQDGFFEWINCSMSTAGPYLRANRGEQDWPAGEFWAKWRGLEGSWAKSIRPNEELDAAKASFFAEHSRYFDIALGD